MVTLKINQQKYNWLQKTCKPLKNTFPGSNWSVIVMRIEQSEVYDKLLVTEFLEYICNEISDFIYMLSFFNQCFFFIQKNHCI